MARVSGGDRMARKLDEVSRRLRTAHTVRAGFTDKATYPNGTPIAMVAAAQNFGAPAANIPPRPFFSNIVRAKRAVWGKELGQLLKAQNMNASKALELMGMRMAGDIKQSIVDMVSPPLSEKTVKRKGFDKPLVDTGAMLQSLDGPGGYEVE